ncbi:MAG: hypothetical protein KDB01_09055 [Planctomycetaceae bacterium]|nr:hypothetical protein [Planctomycetaceae bacterium]
MQSKTILAPLTVLSFVVTGGVVASHVLSEPVAISKFESTSQMDDPLTGSVDSESSVLAMSNTLLMTGVTPTAPAVRSIPVVRAIPWERGELGREFRRGGSQLSCSLLEPGIDVIQPLIAPTAGASGALGRQSAFSINLTLDPAARAALPRVIRGAVENYLKDHQLTIQPVYYHTPDGQPFFGPQVRAAFVEIASPQKTTLAEAMITKSVSELRTLGIYWDKEGDLKPEQARTMILAFQYTLDSKNNDNARSAANQEYELLFLHLLKDSTPTEPKLAVFATSGGRTELNLLDTTDPKSAHQPSVIAAHIRFGELNMLGMYPANPVVTGVFHKARLSLPVDSFKALLEGFASGQPRPLDDVLDELNSRGASGDTSGLFNSPEDTASDSDLPTAAPSETGEAENGPQ